MPIFEFRCHKCAAKFEELIRSSAHEHAISCPQCKSKHVERIMSLFGFFSGAKSVIGSSSSASCDTCSSKNCATCH